MADDLCAMKYIEIVPFDNSRNCSDSPDIQFNVSHVKVCVFFFIFLRSYILLQLFLYLKFSWVLKVLCFCVVCRSISACVM